MSFEKLKWKALKTEHLVNDQWIDFRKVTYEMPDGSVVSPYYTYSQNSYSVVVPYTENGRLITVRQYRQGLHEVTLEFPAGGIENSRSRKPEDEEALSAARRELLEETGYESDKWTHLLTIPGYATLADNYAFIYLAKDCHKIASQNLDPTEYLTVQEYTLNEIEDLVREGKFQQAVHVLALQLAKHAESY